MINATAAYRAAITADARRILLRAVVDLISPDIVYGAVDSSGETIYSKPAQLHDKIFELGLPYASLERNRWLLDGSFPLPDPGQTQQVGFESSGAFGPDGTGNLFVEMQFSGVSTLQACSIYFPTADYDGIPVDFTVAVKTGGTVAWSQSYTDNAAHSVSCTGFTVTDPDAIRVTVTRWSLPGRRMRIPEIIPGIYEIWDGDMMAACAVTQQGSFTGLQLPYGTATLVLDNLDRRFEPFNKSGLFQSLEERQGIELALGVRTPDGDEYVGAGVFYLYSGGWTTGNDAPTIQWNLVDIVGLLSARKFSAGGTLPTTLGGWIGALTAQLGVNFAARYLIDDGYAGLSCTASAEALADKTCGQILMWVCQACGVWARADAATGKLRVGPLGSEGVALTQDNLSAVPAISANDDCASIEFTLSDGTKVTLAGSSPTSPNTLSVQNPFLHTAAAAQAAAALILSAYGGNRIATVGRGDPSGEIGDVATIQVRPALQASARVLSQTFVFQEGVLQGCGTTSIQIGDVSDFDTGGDDA